MSNIAFNSSEQNPSHPEVLDVSPQEVLEKKKDLVIFDVRQQDEFVGELGHIPGARLLVLDTLPAKLAEVPKDKTVVFVCRSGGRSGKATAYALGQGYKTVYNMKGGMLLWNDLQLPVE